MLTRRHIMAASALAIAALTAGRPALAEEKSMTSLFKIVTVKDEIVIGLNAAELKALGGDDAGAVGRAIAKGELTAWQYAVKKAASGDLQQAPLHKVALLAHSSLRVEPYKSPLAVLPHE